MKLVNVQKQLWWVPERNSALLAVPIQTEQEYYPAIRDKLVALMEKAGPGVLDLVTRIMEPQGLVVEPTKDLERLASQVLATASVGEMVREGYPTGPAATTAAATMAVRDQPSLELTDFLA